MANLDGRNWLRRVQDAASLLVTNSPWDILHRAGGYTVSKRITITGSGGAASVNCFSVTGSVRVKGLWGIVDDVTDIAALTVCSWELYAAADAAIPITAAAGTTLTGASLNSLIAKTGAAATALVLANSNQARVLEGATPFLFFEFGATQKDGVATYIRFLNTTDADVNCKITMYCTWVNINGVAGSITAV